MKVRRRIKRDIIGSLPCGRDECPHVALTYACGWCHLAEAAHLPDEVVTERLPGTDVPSKCARVPGVEGVCHRTPADEDGPSSGWGNIVRAYEEGGER